MATEKRFAEIGIIGAGPAGIAASMELSKKGIPHLLLDADHFPRHKACGDILTSSVLRQLNQLDPGIIPGLQSRQLLNPIWHSHIFPPNGKAISLDFLPFDGKKGEASCYSISRHQLDAHLLEKAQQSPYLEFRPGCRIKNLIRNAGGFRLDSESGAVAEVKILILATGSEASLPARLGLEIPDQEMALGIRAHYEGVDWPSNQTGLFLDRAIMPGGLYITPLPDGICNVNLVMTSEKVKRNRISLRNEMQHFLSRHPVLKEKFYKARPVGKPEGSSLYLGTGNRRISGERFLLAGDAAGLIEFFSGNGIPQAYQSGKMAASKAAEALESGDTSAGFLQKYDADVRKKVKKAGSTERIALSLLEKKAVNGLLLRFLNHLSARPQTNDLLRDLLYRKNPAEILRKPEFWYRLLLK